MEQQEHPTSNKNRLSLSLLLFCLVLVVINMALLRQNRQLRSSVATSGRPIILTAGTAVPALRGRDFNGNDLVIDYGNDQKKTLLLVLSPQCTYCAKNMANWQKLLNDIDRQSYRIVAVSILKDNARDYLDQNKLGDVPGIVDIDPKSRVDYELTVTPETILISSSGKVEHVWTGLLSSDQKAEIQQAMHVQLASLTPGAH